MSFQLIMNSSMNSRRFGQIPNRVELDRESESSCIIIDAFLHFYLHMDQKLVQIRSLGQKDKGPAYLSLLSQIFSNTNGRAVASDLHALVDALVTQDGATLVVARQVLTELVKNLSEGIIKDREIKKQIIKDTLAITQPRLVSYEEQVRTSRHSCILY